MTPFLMKHTNNFMLSQEERQSKKSSKSDEQMLQMDASQEQPSELKLDHQKGQDLVNLADDLGITDKKVTSELRKNQQTKK